MSSIFSQSFKYLDRIVLINVLLLKVYETQCQNYNPFYWRNVIICSFHQLPGFYHTRLQGDLRTFLENKCGNSYPSKYGLYIKGSHHNPILWSKKARGKQQCSLFIYQYECPLISHNIKTKVSWNSQYLNATFSWENLNPCTVCIFTVSFCLVANIGLLLISFFIYIK